MSNMTKRGFLASNFNLKKTMESGQVFGWRHIAGVTPNTDEYRIVSGSRACIAVGDQRGANCYIELYYADIDGEYDYWIHYFGLDDRGEMARIYAETMLVMLEDKWPLTRALRGTEGIRVMCEDPWQAMVASFMPDTWSVETRRANLMRMIGASMRAANKYSAEHEWCFPCAENLLAIPMSAPPMSKIGPKIQRMCKEVIAKNIVPYDWTREAGAPVHEAVVNTKLLTGLSMNAIVRLAITGFHYDNIYTEECVTTAWLALNMDEINQYEKDRCDMYGTDYSCKSLLYLRIRYAGFVLAKERAAAKAERLKARNTAKEPEGCTKGTTKKKSGRKAKVKEAVVGA